MFSRWNNFIIALGVERKISKLVTPPPQKKKISITFFSLWRHHWQHRRALLWKSNQNPPRFGERHFEKGGGEGGCSHSFRCQEKSPPSLSSEKMQRCCGGGGGGGGGGGKEGWDQICLRSCSCVCVSVWMWILPGFPSSIPSKDTFPFDRWRHQRRRRRKKKDFSLEGARMEGKESVMLRTKHAIGRAEGRRRKIDWVPGRVSLSLSPLQSVETSTQRDVLCLTWKKSERERGLEK